MRTIVISDLHLTEKFIPKKFKFLHTLISSCDRLVVNGDLWCGSSTTFEKFLSSRWRELFTLMLSKHTVYIPGNHDHQDFIDDRYKLFATSLSKNLTLKNNNTEFFVSHGHQFTKLTYKKNINVQIAIKLHKLKRAYFTPANLIMNKFLALRKIRKLFYMYNRLIFKKAKRISGRDVIFVIGHTHLPEFRPDKGYINTGFISSGHAWYLEISDFSYRLLSARY